MNFGEHHIVSCLDYSFPTRVYTVSIFSAGDLLPRVKNASGPGLVAHDQSYEENHPYEALGFRTPSREERHSVNYVV